MPVSLVVLIGDSSIVGLQVLRIRVCFYSRFVFAIGAVWVVEGSVVCNSSIAIFLLNVSFIRINLLFLIPFSFCSLVLNYETEMFFVVYGSQSFAFAFK